MALALTAAGMAAPAMAGGLEPPHGATPSWCERHADAWAGTGFGRDLGVFVGAGTNLDREVLSGYACYDVSLVGQRRGELLNAWWDPENGNAGASCIRQARADLVSCKRTAVSTPLEGTTPVTHDPDDPWWLHLLAAELDYDVAPTGIEAAGRVQEQCVAGSCIASDRHRAAVRPDGRFRVGGRECRIQGEPSCTRNQAGTGVAYGEGGAPSASLGGLDVTVPALCADADVERDVDVRC